MYHHIDTLSSDEWQLAVSQENFAEQLSVLQNFTVISVAEMVNAIQANLIKPKTIAITFDDGYHDNYSNAAPLLKQHNYPATFFVTNSIGREAFYWWDELESLLLIDENIPGTIDVRIGNENYHWNLSADWTQIISQSALSELTAWIRWNVPPSTRHALFIYLCEKMKTIPHDEQQTIIEQLKQQCQQESNQSAAFATMSVANLEALSAYSQFEIGGHTAEHTALANFSPLIQTEAIESNKLFLEKHLDRPITGFAYPHGSYNSDSIEILQQFGFRFGCTTHEGLVTNESDPYRLPRFHVKDWNGTQFVQQLNDRFRK